jgi:hypothetical protein
MKKLLSISCCVLYLQSLSQPAPLDLRATNAAGKKGLIKALAIIVNREGNKKSPVKKVSVAPSELPWV